VHAARQKHSVLYGSAPPSTRGNVTEFKKLQEKTAEPYAYCNRPYSASNIPVTLLHPLLANFVDDCDTYQPKKDDNAFVSDLTEKMSLLDVPERIRRDEFIECFHTYTGVRLYPADIIGTHYSTDGHAMVDKYPYIITEAKAELSGTSAEPSLQALLYYHEFVKYLNRQSHQSARSTLPCLVIFYLGKPTSVTDVLVQYQLTGLSQEQPSDSPG
jgi:hypothetical protein